MTEIDVEQDSVLVERARGGDQYAFGCLVSRHLQASRRAAVAVVGPAQADDVVQEALGRAHNALGRLDTSRPFRPWLLRIVINEALNQRRGAERQVALASRLAHVDRPSAAAPADRGCLVAEQRTVLFAALESLPLRYRQVIVCRYLLEMSEAETARVLALSPGTVKSRLSRGLARLRKSGRLEPVLHLLPPVGSAVTPSDGSGPAAGQHLPSAPTAAGGIAAAAVSAGALLLVTGYALLSQPPSQQSPPPTPPIATTVGLPGTGTRDAPAPKSVIPMPSSSGMVPSPPPSVVQPVTPPAGTGQR